MTTHVVAVALAIGAVGSFGRSQQRQCCSDSSRLSLAPKCSATRGPTWTGGSIEDLLFLLAALAAAAIVHTLEVGHNVFKRW
jgi:hypothetical protein